MGSGRRMRRKQGAPTPLPVVGVKRPGEFLDATSQRRPSRKRKAPSVNAPPSDPGPLPAASFFDSDEDSDFVFSDDQHGSDSDSDSDGEQKLTLANIEGLSRKLDAQKEEERAAAEAEFLESALQTNVDQVSDALDGHQDNLTPDVQLLRQRITDTVRILDDFTTLAESGRSRSEYVAQILTDICHYYKYTPFLAEKLWNLFPPREALAFFDANETQRPVVLRVNTLRTHRRELAQSLINRGVTLEALKWNKVGLQVFESSVPLGATPEYLAGHYLLQAASSFLPVIALSPQPNERVLDMSAAPGGKSTHCAALMQNTGVLVANDVNKSRAKSLIGNLHRLGARNVIVSTYDARDFPRVMGGFDRVLLDAPCSGSGVVAKDPSVKTSKTEQDFISLPQLQKQLLLAAIDSTNHASKSGGYVVYSTCSVTVEENEAVVQYALRKRPNVKIVDTGLTFGRDGFTSYARQHFNANMRLAKRFYPHTTNMDGFFVCKLQKIGPSPSGERKDEAKSDVAHLAADLGRNMTDEETDDGAFGGFDDEEDELYMQRARKNAMRRRGFNPKGFPK
ncbi:NOL1/NOP2/sun family-domain-containing protein [Ustulina deusta]|nr:NOL1/NOP2/sun family-domain-containing protein [Ustulina deusta]